MLDFWANESRLRLESNVLEWGAGREALDELLVLVLMDAGEAKWIRVLLSSTEESFEMMLVTPAISVFVAVVVVGELIV